MHMPDIYLHPTVYIPMIATSGAVLTVCAAKGNKELDERKVPMMGVMGAFVFAAQMVNFPILPGVSGHLVGGVLLACLLGPYIGTLVMASILIVQCLIFQDGGVLALGANIFNMGVVPCFLGYGIFQSIRALLPRAKGTIVRNIAAFVAALAATVVGSICAVVQIHLSGKNPVSFLEAMAAMAGVHVLIGCVEGLITTAVLNFIFVTKPEVAEVEAESRYEAASMRRFVLIGLVLSLIVGGLVSNMASRSPDALEYVGETKKFADATEGHSLLWKFLPDYTIPGLTEKMPFLSTSLAGILGTLVTFSLCLVVSIVLCRKKPTETGSDGVIE